MSPHWLIAKQVSQGKLFLVSSKLLKVRNRCNISLFQFEPKILPRSFFPKEPYFFCCTTLTQCYFYTLRCSVVFYKRQCLKNAKPADITEDFLKFFQSMCTQGRVFNIKISHEKGLNHMVLRSICSYRKDKHPCTCDVLAFPVAAFQILCTAVKQRKSLTQHLLWT